MKYFSKRKDARVKSDFTFIVVASFQPSANRVSRKLVSSIPDLARLYIDNNKKKTHR